MLSKGINLLLSAIVLRQAVPAETRSEGKFQLHTLGASACTEDFCQTLYDAAEHFWTHKKVLMTQVE